jgi:glutaredoxin
MIITVHGKPGCHSCTATTRWLDKRGLAYRYFHLEMWPDVAERFRAAGHTALPVVTVVREADPKVHEFSGFQVSKLEELFGSAR